MQDRNAPGIKKPKQPTDPESEAWNELPWRKLEQHCFRIQKRIYRASQRGNTRAVQKLQKLLMKSEAARLVAVRRVTQDNQGKKSQRIGLSSRQATWLVLQKPETRSVEDQRLLALLQQAHPQVKVACELAQAFVQMIRARSASAREPWLKEATESGVPELRTFATGLRRDQTAILAALTYEWSHDYVA